MVDHPQRRRSRKNCKSWHSKNLMRWTVKEFYEFWKPVTRLGNWLARAAPEPHAGPHQGTEPATGPLIFTGKQIFQQDCATFCHTLLKRRIAGPFSAVSVPFFASKQFFFRTFRDLYNPIPALKLPTIKLFTKFAISRWTFRKFANILLKLQRNPRLDSFDLSNPRRC